MQLRFYFDVVCPFAYLASTQIERVAREAGAELAWRPILLGGVYRAIGQADRPSEAMVPAKLRMSALDLERWAHVWGVAPPRYPAGHPRRTVRAMRLAACALDEGAAEVAHALYRAYWVEARDLEEPDAVDAIARAAGIDPARLDEPRTKERLRALTDEAVAEGAFGVPSFLVVDGARRTLFWGQDRLPLVAKALAGWPEAGWREA
jgi:2-hydroxychromene-2-carboxylate isomerase